MNQWERENASTRKNWTGHCWGAVWSCLEPLGVLLEDHRSCGFAEKFKRQCRLKKQLAGKTNFSPETRFANRAGEEDGNDVTWLAGDC